LIRKHWLLLAIALIAVTHVEAQTTRSVYTSLDPKSCKTLESTSSEGGYYKARCTGTAGYSLLLEEGDVRQNITVVTPRRTKHSLNLWTVVSPAFSSVGPKAEWRLTIQGRKVTPTAVIIRYNASEDSSNPEKTTSYLVVTKITATEICVTDRVSPGPKANDDARRLADESATKPCLKTPN
jgi:hypothetical protein